MEKPEEIITDKQIEFAWGNANFGEFLNINKRELINNTVLKCASGHHTGHTAGCIAQELGLLNIEKWQLSPLGKKYLYAVYSKGKSY